MPDHQRLTDAFRIVRHDLMNEREPSGHWVGRLASSALATATAVSALTIVKRQRESAGPRSHNTVQDSRISALIDQGVDWLSDQVNADGGWGDTPLSDSNISTTLLCRAALTLHPHPTHQERLLSQADRFADRQGGIPALIARYGQDKSFSVPILTNCALAGIVPWSEVPALPFELAALPQSFYRWARLPVVSYAIPALVAIGQARFHFRRPRNLLMRGIRTTALEPSLRVLERMQPESGGYLEAVPLTGFVVMSLAATGRHDHAIVNDGVRFLADSARPDGSWPIDTDLATWNTTMSINALCGEGPGHSGAADVLDWLFDCQFADVHPFTGAKPGGWGWTDRSGAVPDADDTAGALLALSLLARESLLPEQRRRIDSSVRAGVGWLLDLQNRDGGWPTFCRGWGKLPFDRSGTDLTAHAIRALMAWPDSGPRIRLQRALRRGWAYLCATQRRDGSWHPLWFGNQDYDGDANPVYGTSKVLMAYRDAGRTADRSAERGIDFLLSLQNADGGWGGGRPNRNPECETICSSIEETSLAIEALLGWREAPQVAGALDQGLRWLMGEIEADRHRRATPIGFYFAKLWYYEKLYPLSFAASALRSAARTYLDTNFTQATQVHSAP